MKLKPIFSDFLVIRKMMNVKADFLKQQTLDSNTDGILCR